MGLMGVRSMSIRMHWQLNTTQNHTKSINLLPEETIFFLLNGFFTDNFIKLELWKSALLDRDGADQHGIVTHGGPLLWFHYEATFGGHSSVCSTAL